MQNSGANPGKHNLVAGSLSLTILGLGVSSSFPLDPLTEELVILGGMTSKLSEVAIYSGKPSPVSFPAPVDAHLIPQKNAVHVL